VQTAMEGGKHAHLFYPLGTFQQCIGKLDRTYMLANRELPSTMIVKEFVQFRMEFVAALTAVSEKANVLRENLPHCFCIKIHSFTLKHFIQANRRHFPSKFRKDLVCLKSCNFRN
jgi:hypothetical protein